MQDANTEVETKIEPSSFERLLAGQPFFSDDAELVLMRQHARRLARSFNETPTDEHTTRTRMLASLFGALGDEASVEAPLFVEFGRHIFAGHRLALGPGCVLIDVGRITIGDDVRIEAGVHIFAVARPVNPTHRAKGFAQAAPVTIGDNVWIGGRSVIDAGVTIGEGTAIAPGSVVLDDLPSQVYAAGNPCRVLKEL